MRRQVPILHRIYFKEIHRYIKLKRKPLIPIEKVFKFVTNTTDEMMLDIKNYGEIVHNQRNCHDMRLNGTCRTIRHEPASF